MNNNNDEMYEVSDYDEDIQQREALIAEAEQIDGDAEWDVIARAIADLRRKWKQIS